MTIWWLTDANRQDMRDAEEERLILDELVRRYRPMRTITTEERAERTARHQDLSRMSILKIDPYGRG